MTKFQTNYWKKNQERFCRFFNVLPLFYDFCPANTTLELYF